ncbi:snRNA-activating protein complex subunit 4-like [Leguminivora glycinivorella]|uniref:snRNA-activating protein complex subunit 4-like n=1 Tax=Leguminivora glycinivorella TaxID=1035111 RepID=UPI00200C5031|nr:snRNA-activating protein complex subunit 4-like [Leguminivora glycinivorella]
MDVDSDEEQQLNDIAQLNAVLAQDDEPSILLGSLSGSVSSLHSRSLTSTSTASAAQEHARIDSALALNKLLDEKLRRLESVLVGRLHECRQNLNDLHKLAGPAEKDRQETFRYINCGKPYFKDKSNFPAPDNEDTIIMKKSNMYDFSEITSVPGWTAKDKVSLNKLLLEMSINIKKKELNSKIAQLKRENKDKWSRKLERQVDAINKEISNLGKKTLKDLALPIDQEYDWEIIANKLNKRHSAAEYRILWKEFLHPNINKEPWSMEEHAHFQEIVAKFNFQDWAAIAKELNTGRTAYQVFVYYRTNMSNTSCGKKWTKEEEQFLQRLIAYYKEEDYIPWGKVASSMENRTKIQIYNKYFRLVEKRKGRFLPEEDAVILTCLDKFGPNFKKMSEYLPGRSATQIRVRYQVLAKKRISAVWTVQEDRQLLQLMANEECLTNYSSVTKHFPDKTRVHLRARYATLLKWMKKHPNSSLENAPRRGARRLGHGLASDNLNKATEVLKKRIETEIDNRKSKRITRESPLEVIEDAIVANLLTEHVKQEEERKQYEIYDEDELFVFDSNAVVSVHSLNVSNLQKIMIFLRAKLKQDLFKKSSYAEKYPGLLDTQQEVNLFQVKSYSRKQQTNVVKFTDAPDLWGNNTLGNVTYVLPPHYATITGCRKLMAHINTKTKENALKPESNINLNHLIRRNTVFKQQMFLFMERFNSLFLYSMLLSNEGPERVGTMALTDYQHTTDTSRAHLNDISSISIPGPSQPFCGGRVKLDSFSDTNMSIDLPEPADVQKDQYCVQKVVVGDQVRYIAEDESKISKVSKKRKIPYVCT